MCTNSIVLFLFAFAIPSFRRRVRSTCLAPCSKWIDFPLILCRLQNLWSLEIGAFQIHNEYKMRDDIVLLLLANLDITLLVDLVVDQLTQVKRERTDLCPGSNSGSMTGILVPKTTDLQIPDKWYTPGLKFCT